MEQHVHAISERAHSLREWSCARGRSAVKVIRLQVLVLAHPLKVCGWWMCIDILITVFSLKLYLFHAL